MATIEAITPVVTTGYIINCQCGIWIEMFAGNYPLPYDVTCSACGAGWQISRCDGLPMPQMQLANIGKPFLAPKWLFYRNLRAYIKALLFRPLRWVRHIEQRISNF